MSVKNYTSIHHLVDPVTLSASKETEPLTMSNEPLEIHEIAEQKEVHKSVKNHIEVKKENIELTPELEKAGLETTETSQFPTHKKIHLPISDEKIVAGMHQPITSSFRWLAMLAIYILKQAHLTLKVVHGKVIRKSY